MYQWGPNKSLLETIVPQLDKYLKFVAFPAVILYGVVILFPQIDLNLDIYPVSCGITSVLMMCNELFILQELL